MDKKSAYELYMKHGGRAGISERLLEIAKEIIDVNSYKRAIAGAGQISLYAEIASKADEYWAEMVARGKDPEMRYLHGASKPILKADGHMDWDVVKEAQHEKE